MRHATGYITNRVDFSYNDEEYTDESALEEIVDNNFEGTDNVIVNYKEVTTTIIIIIIINTD
jgi:hypothetical protein